MVRYSIHRHALMLDNGAQLAWEPNVGLSTYIYAHVQGTVCTFLDFMTRTRTGQIDYSALIVIDVPGPQQVLDCFRRNTVQVSASAQGNGLWTVWIMPLTTARAIANVIRMGSCRLDKPHVFLTVWTQPGCITHANMHHNYAAM